MTIRVFIVEDLPGLRSLLHDLFLGSPAFRVVGTASNEGEAKLWLDEHPQGWDLAIVDLILEVGSGMGVIRHARASPDPGRVIVFSGYASAGVKAHCLDLGAEAVFDKANAFEFTSWLKDLASREAGGPK